MISGHLSPPRVYPSEIIRQPMCRIVERLKRDGLNLASTHALEFFAREGDWQTTAYAKEVGSLDAREVNPEHEVALRRNLPNAAIRIGDSFVLARAPEFAGRFEFIVVDNPQMIFGGHCEHFDALPLVPELLAGGGIVVFNVNHSPYGYDRHPEWEICRQRFYRIQQTAELKLDFLDAFYRNYFLSLGCRTRKVFFEQRHEPSIAYCVMQLEK